MCARPREASTTRQGGTRRAGWWLPAIVAGAAALHLPSLAMGYYADDHAHQLALEGKLPLEPLGLYDFGTAEDWRALGESVGGFPWWTSPDWKIRFFRPLTSATLWLDRAIFGTDAAAAHAVNLGLFAALLFVLHALYRALGFGRGLALAGTALVGVSQATALPVAWIANRNTLLATLFTAGAVAFVASHERLGRGRALAWAAIASAFACLSKESGVAAFALVALYLVTAPHALPRPWTARAAAAMAACALAFVAALALAGYGTRSLFYATPWDDPARFAANLGVIETVGPLAILTPVPSDLLFVMPEAKTALVVVALLVTVPVAAWMARRFAGERMALFLGAWTLVSLVPEAGTIPSDRLLLTATIGGAGLLAMLFARTLPRAAGRPWFERSAAALLLFLAGPLEAAACVSQVVALRDAAVATREKVVGAQVGDPSLGRRTVVLVQSDDPLVPFGFASTWAFATRDLDVRVDVLQTGGRGLRWTREDDRTLVVEATDRPFVTDPLETVYRSREMTPPVGTIGSASAFSAEVLGVDPAGGVRRVRFRFDESIDPERTRFLVARGGRYVRVAPPAPGATEELAEIETTNPFEPR